MKKIFYIALAALAFASCNKEVNPSTDVEEVTVTVDVNLPDMVSTKVIGDGLSATKLYYEVWSSDKTTRFYRDSKDLVQKVTQVQFNLVKNQTYNILFWAQAPDAAFYGIDDTDGLSVITMDYSAVSPATGIVANDEERDAFYNNELQNLLVTGPMTEDISLVRPFAQVNFGTTPADIEAAKLIGGMKPVASKVTFNVNFPTVLNLFSGEVSGEQTLTFDYTALPAVKQDGYLEVDIDKDGKISDAEKYIYLSMNYVLVNQTETTNADITANIQIMDNGDKPQSDVVVKTVNAPLRRNFRTNVLGNLLTAPGVFNIVVDERFADNEFPQVYEDDTLNN